MPTVDPLQQLLSGLERENEDLLKAIEEQNRRFEAMDVSMSELLKLLKAQDERLSALETLCETLSKE